MRIFILCMTCQEISLSILGLWVCLTHSHGVVFGRQRLPTTAAAWAAWVAMAWPQESSSSESTGAALGVVLSMCIFMAPSTKQGQGG